VFPVEDVGEELEENYKRHGRDVETVSDSPKHIAPQCVGDRPKE